jgi:hypothetical protein
MLLFIFREVREPQNVREVQSAAAVLLQDTGHGTVFKYDVGTLVGWDGESDARGCNFKFKHSVCWRMCVEQ